jgi:hypothetical protein
MIQQLTMTYSLIMCPQAGTLTTHSGKVWLPLWKLPASVHHQCSVHQGALVFQCSCAAKSLATGGLDDPCKTCASARSPQAGRSAVPPLQMP